MAAWTGNGHSKMNPAVRGAEGPQIDISGIRFVGSGLVRPECVLASRDGDLYTADWRGGVARVRSGGTATLYTAGALPGGRPLRPK